MSTLRSSHPALAAGRTIYLKSVTKPQDAKRLLQPASTNRKLGGGKTVITRGRWRGMPMYQLSLEERETCPKTCQQWASCYGNNMPFARRIATDDWAALSGALGSELATLAAKHPLGFVVRLHVLGDFFSVSYVKFWQRALARHAELRLFGYTHRSERGLIGRNIAKMNDPDQCWIRWSDAGGEMSANVDKPDGTPGEGIHCPQQTGKTESCLTCGLCWAIIKPIRFSGH